jgi:hypothetical protein
MSFISTSAERTVWPLSHSTSRNSAGSRCRRRAVSHIRVIGRSTNAPASMLVGAVVNQGMRFFVLLPTRCTRLIRRESGRRVSETPASRTQCGSGRAGVAGSAPSRREWTAQMMCRSRGRARLWSECFCHLGRPARAARARLARGTSCLADERARRKRARSVADAAPNARRSAGPSDPIVSSTGMLAMCANEIIERSPWCSRRPGGAPRGRGRGRRGGRGSRRRSRGRPASHRRASS